MTATALPGFSTKRGGLHYRLLLFIVLPLVMISALSIHLGLNQMSSIQEDRMKMDLDLIGRAIRIPVANALTTSDREEMQQVLESLFSIGRVYGVSIFDTDGALLASTGVAEDDLTGSRIPEAIAATGEALEDYRQVDGRDVFSHFVPIFDTNSQIAGLIQINRRASDFDNAINQLSLIAWLVWAGLSTAVIIIVLLGHYGGVGRYVDKLLSHMHRIETGEQSHRAEVTGPGEVRAIATGLNQMLDSIDQSQQRILEHQATEQRLSQRLRDNEKMAVVGRMARGIAHELGAPLNVIDARTQRLRRHLENHPDAGREIDGVRSQVARLTNTVYQLLDYSRPDAPDLSEVELRGLIESSANALQPEGQAADVALELELPDAPLIIRGNSKRLESTLLNLIRNAIQAAESQVRIHLSASSEGANLSIEDDGPGFEGSPEQLLEPFYTTKPAGEGTGLGLAIAHNIVREHGGTLSLENRPDGGCRANLFLPFEPPSSRIEDSHS